jgi:hypothetical protein
MVAEATIVQHPNVAGALGLPRMRGPVALRPRLSPDAFIEGLVRGVSTTSKEAIYHGAT